jgi:hypothetical protein
MRVRGSRVFLIKGWNTGQPQERKCSSSQGVQKATGLQQKARADAQETPDRELTAANRRAIPRAQTPMHAGTLSPVNKGPVQWELDSFTRPW